AIRLHERVPCRIVPMAAHIVVDRLTQRLPAIGVPVEAEALDAAERAIDGDPRHDLRMREVPARAAHFPDALVRLIPDVGEMVDERALEGPVRLAGFEAAAAALVQGVHHLAEHVELPLPVRRVADAHRPRRLVTGQPRPLELGETPLATEA